LNSGSELTNWFNYHNRVEPTREIVSLSWTSNFFGIKFSLEIFFTSFYISHGPDNRTPNQ